MRRWDFCSDISKKGGNSDSDTCEEGGNSDSDMSGEVGIWTVT